MALNKLKSPPAATWNKFFPAGTCLRLLWFRHLRFRVSGILGEILLPVCLQLVWRVKLLNKRPLPRLQSPQPPPEMQGEVWTRENISGARLPVQPAEGPALSTSKRLRSESPASSLMPWILFSPWSGSVHVPETQYLFPEWVSEVAVNWQGF